MAYRAEHSYEMASGIRPFRGDSSVSILSSIIRGDPAPLSMMRVREMLSTEPMGDADTLCEQSISRVDAAKFERATSTRGDVDVVEHVWS